MRFSGSALDPFRAQASPNYNYFWAQASLNYRHFSVDVVRWQRRARDVKAYIIPNFTHFVKFIVIFFANENRYFYRSAGACPPRSLHGEGQALALR